MNLELHTFLKQFLAKQPWLVLTGAGVSVDSGIPTYRDDSGKWLRSDPIKHFEFIQHETVRRRYWGRSIVGWPYVEKAKPNQSHHLLAELEKQNAITGIVTQNVDRLHQKAGSQNVTDLHGRIDRVRCLNCGAYESRQDLQVRLLEFNPFLQKQTAELAPDGDAYVEDEMIQNIKIANCLQCGGTLMPDVIFFGGIIPKEVHQQTRKLLDASTGVLVIGSSLMVYSGYSFCKTAKEENKPVLIANKGKTRADDIATAKLEMDCEIALVEMLRYMG